MLKRNIASWNALMYGMAQRNFLYEALNCSKKVWNGLKSDELTMLSNHGTCSQMWAEKEEDKVWGYIKERGLDTNVIVYNTMIICIVNVRLCINHIIWLWCFVYGTFRGILLDAIVNLVKVLW